MPLSSLSPEFRESLRSMADSMRKQDVPQPPRISIVMAMDSASLDDVEDISDEGSLSSAGEKGK